MADIAFTIHEGLEILILFRELRVWGGFMMGLLTSLALGMHLPMIINFGLKAPPDFLTK